MYEQIKLPYSTDALEPYIDKETVETHYGKHHATYTTNFNDLAAQAGVEDESVEEILANLDQIGDDGLRKAIRNQGGGYYNHNLYFEMLSPNAAKAPKGKLEAAINMKFGSLEACMEELSKKATIQFGSGWAFLSVDEEGGLHASNSLNQDNPLSEGKGWTPILALDVWEHAYYLKYKNLRAEYIKNFWEILCWEKVSARYDEIVG